MAMWIDGHGIRRKVTDVFVSYSQADSVRVAPIVQQLHAEALTVFWDRDIPAGVDYMGFLSQALEKSRIVLVVWSRKSVRSEWVLAEAEFARSRKRLVSCKIENCKPILPFNTFQTVDLSGWNGDATDENWRQVADLILHRVKRGNARRAIGQIED